MHNTATESDLAVRLTDVTFVYPGSEEPVLNGASLAIERGSFTAIIGGNGCGKSTLCKLFNGLIPHYYVGDFSGEVEICGQPANTQNVAELSRMVGYVYQDFDNQLVRPTVLDEAMFAPLNYGLPDYRVMGLQALEMCGLSHLQDRYIWELSGGQKHLLALAGALSLSPDILVVDEPVSQLDPQHARQVYEVLRSLNEHYGKTVIVIEHHTEFIADYCKEVCLMENGQVLWQLPVADGLNRLDDLARLSIQPPEVTQAAVHLSSLLRKENGAASPDQQDWPEDADGRGLSSPPESAKCMPGLHPDNAPRLGQGEVRYPVTTDEAVAYFSGMLGGRADLPGAHNSSEASGGHSRPGSRLTESGPEDAQARPVVEFKQARLSYRTIRRAEREVLRGINLSLYEGERIALVGNNGAGKSSLLRLIAGIAKPSAGAVEVMGEDTKHQSIEQLSSHVSYVFQNPEDMFIEDNVYKEVAHCLKSRAYPDAEQRISQMLESFRLESLKDRDARLLSGGQQRRVSLAIGAAVLPHLILLDEPTANLDLATREELLGTLQDLEGFVRTVVIATHDMQLVQQWATRVIVLTDGTVAGDGSAADIFADHHLISRAGLAPTQIMDTAARLDLHLTGSTPAEFAQLVHAILTGKEVPHHAACPQLA